ncbi:MAG: hypothetical protein O2900_00985 [Proteobacteria bacterium]|nr:hypothetical protein [Pseudomonadota bacterium]
MIARTIVALAGMDSTSQSSNLPTEKYWHPKSVRTLSGSPVDLRVSSTLNT